MGVWHVCVCVMCVGVSCVGVCHVWVCVMCVGVSCMWVCVMCVGVCVHAMGCCTQVGIGPCSIDWCGCVLQGMVSCDSGGGATCNTSCDSGGGATCNHLDAGWGHSML